MTPPLTGGLETFGFELPPQKPRGPVIKPGMRQEVHRLGIPGAFIYEVTTWNRPRSGGDPYFRRIVVPREKVADLWDAIGGIITRGGKTRATPDLTPRQVLHALINMVPENSPYKGLNPDTVMGGRHRAAFYFPRYYYPLIVLDLYFYAVERKGRSLRVVKAGEALAI